ncbi:MAG: sigma-70 family RNA polymerase sigma factor [Verrucomicrobia bacterium]|nr:sigma-70 family RNA polymerase sigma factor [Verrucomicrobiota bacterium]
MAIISPVQSAQKSVGGEEFIPTRLSLLSRLKRWDDHGSWRDFFDTYWKFLYCVAIKSGLSDEDARDVVQETVVAVAKGLRDGRFKAAEGSSFKAWLQLIVRRRVADHLRKRRLPLAESATPVDETARTPTIERVPAPDADVVLEVWEEEWAKNLADAAIERVKQRVEAKQFQMFDLYVLKEWPVGEVARTLKANVAQVYLAKHRVTAMIKQETDRLRKRMETEQ